MRTPRVRARAGLLPAAVVALVAALAPAGCSGSISLGGGDPAVDRGEVEQQVREQLGETVGREPEEVACPDDLPAEVGRTMRCTLTDSGTTLGVTLTVTSVDADDTRFDIEVDQLGDEPADQPAQ